MIGSFGLKFQKMQVLTIFLQLLLLYCTVGKSENATTSTVKPKGIVEKLQAAKYENPNFVRDRLKNETYKPQLYPPKPNPFKKPYHPAWQDYCDPYHCNDYHKIACGINRISRRFKWFQSLCHLALNNMCATYRGFLRYDVIDNKYCQVHVMHLRSQCGKCDEDDDVPICAVSTTSDVVLFKNRCAMDTVNCEKRITEYQQVQMFLCEFYIDSLVK